MRFRKKGRDQETVQALAHANVLKQIRSELMLGRFDALREILSYSGEPSDREIGKLAWIWPWTAYWDFLGLNDSYPLIVSRSECDEALLLCYEWYGEEAVKKAIRGVNLDIERGLDMKSAIRVNTPRYKASAE